MTGSLVVMAAGEDGAMEGVIRRYIDASLVSEDMVVELPVGEVGAEHGGDILQGCLQMLEYERVRFGRVADVLV